MKQIKQIFSEVKSPTLIEYIVSDDAYQYFSTQFSSELLQTLAYY